MSNLYISALTRVRLTSAKFAAWAKRNLSGAQSSLKVNVFLWILILSVSFGGLLLCNLTTDYCSDDLSYLCKIEMGQALRSASVPLENFYDIVQSQYNHYFSVNGRFVAHFALQTVMFYFDQNIVDILSSLFTVALAALIAYYSNFGYEKKHISKTQYLLSFSLLVLLNPEVYDTMYWTTGVFNYNFTILLVLAFFGAYLGIMKNENITRPTAMEAARALFLLVLGVLSGWTNENIGPSLVCAASIVLMHRSFVYRKNISFSDYAGLAGAIVGCCMLLLSPANFARSESIAEKKSKYGSVMKIIIRLYYMERALFIYLFGAAALLIVLLIINRVFIKKKIAAQSNVFMLWAFLSYAAMIFSPSYPERAVFGTLSITLIPIVSIFSLIKWKSRSTETGITIISALLFLSALSRLYTTSLYSVLK